VKIVSKLQKERQRFGGKLSKHLHIFTSNVKINLGFKGRNRIFFRLQHVFMNTSNYAHIAAHFIFPY